jgi:hypothetical protein
MEFTDDRDRRSAIVRTGSVILIPEGDRHGGIGPMELLLTHVPHSLNPHQEWAHVKGVELDGGVATDFPVRVVVRALLLREVAVADADKPERAW